MVSEKHLLGVWFWLGPSESEELGRVFPLWPGGSEGFRKQGQGLGSKHGVVSLSFCFLLQKMGISHAHRGCWCSIKGPSVTIFTACSDSKEPGAPPAHYAEPLLSTCYGVTSGGGDQQPQSLSLGNEARGQVREAHTGP